MRLDVIRTWFRALDRRVYAWHAVAFAGLMVGIRLWPGQVGQPLNLFEPFAAYAMIPIWPALAYARWRRLRELTAVCLFLALAHLGWVFDFVPRLRRMPEALEDAPHLRLVTANLLAPVGSVPLARELLAMDADVIVASELSDRWSRIFGEQGVYARYPHVRAEVIPERSSYFGIGVLSRLPITDYRIEHLGEVPLLSVDLEVEGNSVRLYAFHAHPPMGAGALAAWEAQIDALLRHVRADLAQGRRVIVTGDFNTTSMTRGYRRFIEAGLIAGHEAVWRPFATTWPNGTRFFPPVRLDHLFVHGLEVRSVREGRGEGTDHRPFLSELVVLPPVRLREEP